jgi:hypothetical protein
VPVATVLCPYCAREMEGGSGKGKINPVFRADGPSHYGGPQDADAAGRRLKTEQDTRAPYPYVLYFALGLGAQDSVKSSRLWPSKARSTQLSELGLLTKMSLAG